MERIEGQAEIQTKIARLVLAWVVWATRPLRSLELQHAIAAAFEEDSFDEDNLWRIEDIVSMCAGIITVDEQSDIVQLRHYTRYEFLKNHWTEFFPDPHIQLTTICIAYMRHEALQDGNTASYGQFMGYLERFPPFEYSAKNWGFHARMSYSKVKEDVLAFVQSEKYLPRSLRALFTDRYLSLTRQGCSIAVSPLHPAAYFGLEECLLHFLSNNHVTRDMKDDCGQTALHWAAINGQVEAAELLLNHALEVNWADKKGKTALHYAAGQDDARLVKLLIHYKADMEYADMDGQTPLLTAVQNIKLETAQELVRLGASIKATDSMHRSALHLSALGGSRSIHITKFLLARGACSESCDVQNMTPMHYAILQGPEDAVEALIQAGVYVDAGIVRKRWKRTEKSGKWHYDISPGDQKAPGTRISDGLTPLHWAALIGHLSMVKYLLSKGADPNKCCQDGDTPLHLAIRANVIRDYDDAWNSPSSRIEIIIDVAEAGSEEADDARRHVSEIRSAVIEVLLSHPRIDVDIQNEQLQTPLHLVASGRDDSMIPFAKIMSKKPDHSICNDKGQTPLHLASCAGKAEMVKRLLAARASVDILDFEGLSPLQYSVRSGRSAAVIQLLLECYDMAQLNPCTRKDGAGRNLLHHYLQADYPSQDLVLTLLNHGANMNEIDIKGDSPLSLCLRTSDLISNRASICRFLLENGASALWTDKSGRNLAHISMLADPWNPVDDVLLTLTEFGVDIAAKDSYNRGILHHGAMSGSVTQGVIDLLKESGSLSLHERDNDGRTPLSYAEAEAYLNREFTQSKQKLTLDVLLKANEE
jgi:ankyrin repeat protein